MHCNRLMTIAMECNERHGSHARIHDANKNDPHQKYPLRESDTTMVYWRCLLTDTGVSATTIWKGATWCTTARRRVPLPKAMLDTGCFSFKCMQLTLL